jgi:uncharacterized protein YxeA
MKKALFLLLFLTLIVYNSFSQGSTKAGEGAAYILGESKAAEELKNTLNENKKILDANRNVAMTNYNEAHLALKNDNIDLALSNFNTALSNFKNSTHSKTDLDMCYLYLAYCYAKNDDKGYCLSSLSKISNNKKKDRDLAFGMGVILLMIDENIQAESQFIRSIELDKYFKNGYNRLLQLYVSNNESEKEIALRAKMNKNKINLN